ncbi:peroxidase 18-like [Tripterygium wilfordii]|uniref:Peroxidase n=1 Tax=Tripterygium wilfordii TaxID=458696 RepID=A0A7J7BWL5_TRIWF|nr:peroxidase 18-like [Tripterygium wilfordii]
MPMSICAKPINKAIVGIKTMVFSATPDYCKFFFLVFFSLSASFSSASLSFNFYGISCPSAEFMVRNTVRSAASNDPTIPGKLLRLVFHDCFVKAGGPAIDIPTGRRDGRVSVAANVRPNIVDTSFTVDEMLSLFSSKGLSPDDLVTLSGAHTIGSAHCSAFSDRFRKDSKGMTHIDASLDSIYADELMKKCPAGRDSSITVNNDPETSLVFDNQYYRNLLTHRGLFQSDSVLLNDERTRKQVEFFAEDQESFFRSWSQSFLKLISIGVKTDNEGDVRVSCSGSND